MRDLNRPTDVAGIRRQHLRRGWYGTRASRNTREGKWIKNGVRRGAVRPVQGRARHQIDAANKRVRRHRDNSGSGVRRRRTFKTQFRNVGSPWAPCITPGPKQFLYVSNSNPPNNSITTRDPQDGARRPHHRQVRASGKLLKEFGTVMRWTAATRRAPRRHSGTGACRRSTEGRSRYAVKKRTTETQRHRDTETQSFGCYL